MSREVLQIVIKMNRRELSTKLALQCAPVLTGIKVANLLIVEAFLKETVQRTFDDSVLSCYLLLETEDKVTFLIYDEKALEEYLREQSVAEIMQMLGYHEEKMAVQLEKFSNRYESYSKGEAGFPHEMGLFLGYPSEDVLGFIREEGKNFLYTGYWKVYGDVAKAQKTFQEYNDAKEQVIRMIAQGISVNHIMHQYIVK
ncbi:hypothetical protein lbkm_1475 [Lachnospiraceae bacterium KM106-2]|nr:hypothetical protein lbkm_1475 [Lachnospiraceae bacterium KM106-2]